MQQFGALPVMPVQAMTQQVWHCFAIVLLKLCFLALFTFNLARVIVLILISGFRLQGMHGACMLEGFPLQQMSRYTILILLLSHVIAIKLSY